MVRFPSHTKHSNQSIISYLFAFLCLCLSLCLCLCLCLCLSLCVCVSVSVSVCLSVCLSLFLFLPVCPSYCLSVCLPPLHPSPLSSCHVLYIFSRLYLSAWHCLPTVRQKCIRQRLLPACRRVFFPRGSSLVRENGCVQSDTDPTGIVALCSVHAWPGS